MILKDSDIQKIVRKGGKVFGSNGKPIVVKPSPSKPVPDSQWLMTISSQLSQLLKKETTVELPRIDIPKQEPPLVNVPPAEVTVNVYPARKWQFDIERNYQGYMERVIATAIE